MREKMVTCPSGILRNNCFREKLAAPVLPIFPPPPHHHFFLICYFFVSPFLAILSLWDPAPGCSRSLSSRFSRHSPRALLFTRHCLTAQPPIVSVSAPGRVVSCALASRNRDPSILSRAILCLSHARLKHCLVLCSRFFDSCGKKFGESA